VERKKQNWIKRHKTITGTVALVIVIVLTAGGVLLATAKHSPTTKQQTTSQVSSQSASNTTTADSAYKLGACTSGATQTIGNAAYLVGTDIAPGSYKVVSQTGDTGWTNINIYTSKADYDKQGDPTNEQGNPNISLAPQNGTTTVTKLSDGQYMVLDADPATFTCE